MPVTTSTVRNRTAVGSLLAALASTVLLVGGLAASPAAGAAVDPSAARQEVGSIAYIDVNLRSQQATAFGWDGQVLRSMPVSTGSNGRTPRGTYQVTRKSASTVSLTDARVSMRWMTNFNGGIGFHGIPRKGGRALYTPLGQRAVSAGCVRMSDEDAQFVFDNAPVGTRVNVFAK